MSQVKILLLESLMSSMTVTDHWKGMFNKKKKTKNLLAPEDKPEFIFLGILETV